MQKSKENNWKKILKIAASKMFNIICSSFLDENGKGSGKRFSLFASVLCLFWIVIFHTDHDNSISIATIVAGLIAALAGVTAYQATNKKQ